MLKCCYVYTANSKGKNNLRYPSDISQLQTFPPYKQPVEGVRQQD